MRILSHPDPIVLEQALLGLLDAGHPAREVGRSLVVVPTARLAAHVQRRLASRGRPAWIGVEVVTMRALARDILARAGSRAPRVLSTQLREALVRSVLRLDPDNFWSRFIERRPGAGRRLTSALNELREAAILPEDLLEVARGNPRDQARATLYAAYDDRLTECLEAGWV